MLLSDQFGPQNQNFGLLLPIDLIYNDLRRYDQYSCKARQEYVQRNADWRPVMGKRDASFDQPIHPVS